MGQGRASLCYCPFLLPVACVRRVTFGLEGAQASPSPTCAKVGRIGAARAPEVPGHVQERPEQGGAVVVQQLDQVGLEDEAAQLDQVSGALLSRLGPIAGVIACACGIEAVAFNHQPPQPCRCR